MTAGGARSWRGASDGARIVRVVRCAIFCLVASLALCGAPASGSAQGSKDDGAEEAAQKAYLEAMKMYDQGDYPKALKLLETAEKAAKKLPDRGWRTNVLKTLGEAKVGILYEAGLTSFKKEAFDTAYKYFDRCIALMSKGDKRRPTVKRSMAKSAYMLTMQLWLSRKYDRARESARAAQVLAKEVYPAGSAQRQRLDAVHVKVTMEHTDYMVAQGDVRAAYDELKKDFALQEDPRFAYQLGELGTQLRAFNEAERYYALARDRARERGGEAELAALVEQSEDKIVQMRSLKRTVVVRSNVPFYQVEVYRPFRETPIAERQPEDATEGGRFELYPGRYRIQVFNPDYGVCVREDVPVRNEDLDLECNFEKPPTAVSIDTSPSGVRVRVAPSTMVAFRRTPFYTELYRGSYTLLVEMDDYPGTIEIPFVVESEGTQDFFFDLDYAEIDIQLPAAQADARVRVDGRPAMPTPDGTLRVGIGSHMLEVSKPGYEPYRQRVFFKPRETKSLVISLIEQQTVVTGQAREAPLLDIGVDYGLQGASFRARGGDAGAPSERDDGFVLHQVGLGAKIFLTRNKDAAIKPYIPVDVGIGFALGNPIQSILGVDVSAGFGLAFERLERSRWFVDAGYRFVYTRWNDEFVETEHRLTTTQPLGFLLRGGGHYSLLHTSATLGYTQGSGRRDNLAFASADGVRGCSTDVDVSWLDAEARVGVDLVDAFGYRPDLDVVLGVFGGVLLYDETQRSLRNGGNTCRDLPTANFTRTDGRVGAQLQVRYATGTAPNFAVLAGADLFFVGGLVPQAPLVYDQKLDINPRFGNFRATLGFELGF